MVKITEALVRKKSEHNECLISTLEELSLHQEDIEKIEHLQNWCRDLQILLLQSNLIAKIENLHKLRKLEYLNLAVNNIERVENLEALESLQKLDLTLNFIGEVTSVESLAGNYNLRNLILTGNPCTDYPNYRDYVIATLPQLDSLDCSEVTATDKLLAKKKLPQLRPQMVQCQAVYAMERDAQKIRVRKQKEQLESRMAGIPDEEDRIKAFWDSKSEHCPEIRNEIARYHSMCRKKDGDKEKATEEKKEPHLFDPSGRPYNMNKPKLPFSFKDEDVNYSLELSVYKYLDTSLLDVDVQPHYIRVMVKGKIFQIYLAEEVNTSKAKVQRSQITGALLVEVPKMKCNDMLTIKSNEKEKGLKKEAVKKAAKIGGELKGPVNIHTICDPSEEPPELVDS